MHPTDTQTGPGDADRPLPGKQRPRVRVRPTRYGVLFVVVLAGLLAGAVNYANNLAYLLTFQLTGMMLVSGFVAHRCLAGIRIADIRAPAVFAGDTVIVETRLTGLADHHYRLRMAFGDDSGSESPILGAGPATVHTAVPTLQRGRLHLGRVHLATRFPLGLLEARRQLPAAVDCTVYPRPVAGATAPRHALSGNGSGNPSAMSGSDDFNGLRRYRPGDNLRHVSWKAYSRGRGLLTKEFTGLAGWTEMIDYHRLDDKDVERRLGILCHLVLAAGRQQTSFGLKLPGLTILPDSGPAHQRRCLEALALVDAGGV